MSCRTQIEGEMLKQEPCRESLEEMTEPFVGKKKSGAYSAREKGSSSSPIPHFRSITLLDNHARLFRGL